MPQVSGTAAAKPGKTKVQSLVFNRGSFTTAEAKSWAKSHGYRSTGVEVGDASIRIRQYNPEDFKSGSFRTISLASGIKAVVGKPTKVEKSAEVGSLLLAAVDAAAVLLHREEGR